MQRGHVMVFKFCFADELYLESHESGKVRDGFADFDRMLLDVERTLDLPAGVFSPTSPHPGRLFHQPLEDK